MLPRFLLPPIHPATALHRVPGRFDYARKRAVANPGQAHPPAAKTHITRTRKQLTYLYLTSSVAYQATLSIPHFSLAEQSGMIDASNSRLVSVIMNFRRKNRTSNMPAPPR